MSKEKLSPRTRATFLITLKNPESKDQTKDEVERHVRDLGFEVIECWQVHNARPAIQEYDLIVQVRLVNTARAWFISRGLMLNVNVGSVVALLDDSQQRPNALDEEPTIH